MANGIYWIILNVWELLCRLFSCLNDGFKKKEKGRKVEEVQKLCSWQLGSLQLTNSTARQWS